MWEKGIKVTHQLTIREIILGHPRWPNIIMTVFKQGRGRQTAEM